ncbi:hypothetical protein [Dongia sp.]|uniref:hypothetical protein n=1 Tax=Dongia sp. TaxID=1977262 RepID=UPI0035B3F47A
MAGFWSAVITSCRKRPYLVLGLLFALLGFAGSFAIIWCAAQTGSMRVSAWLAAILAFAGVFICLGLGVNGRVLGAVIDERNRYSLSRLQMAMWSILLLPSIYVVALTNLHFDPSVITNPDKNVQIILFDWNLLYLLGISVGSVIVSPLTLSLKSNQAAAPGQVASAAAELDQMQNLGGGVTATGQLIKKDSPASARFGDLVRGEEVANATIVDFPRVQMLIITGIVLVIYAVGIHSVLAGTLPISRFPKLDDLLLGLILLSHGGYLAGKLTPTTSAKADVTRHLARALQLSQRATDLVRQLESRFGSTAEAKTAAGHDPLVSAARSLAADAAAIPATIGSDTFKEETLSKLEGKYDAIAAGAAQLVGAANGGNKDFLAAPAPDVVRKLQVELQKAKYDVPVDGIPDVKTERAVGDLLAKLKIPRTSLSPVPYRFYEEVLDLL